MHTCHSEVASYITPGFPWQTELTLPRMSTKRKFFHYHHCYCCSRIQVQKALYILILSLSQVFFIIIKLNYTSWVLDELLSPLLGWLRPVSCFSSICLHVSNPASCWLLSHRRLSHVCSPHHTCRIQCAMTEPVLFTAEPWNVLRFLF